MVSTVVKKISLAAAALIMAVLILPSCKKETDDGIPSYIRIDTIMLNTINGQGSNSHKITDAWIFVDGQAMGAFELPCTIPVLKEGQHDISIRPGIKLNGVAATRVPYVFYDFYQTTTTLYKDSVIKLNPTVKYFSDIQFPYIEDFSSGGISLIKDPVFSDVDIVRVTNGPELMEGPCGLIELPAGETDSAFIFMNTPIALPAGGTNVYLELNYKTNYPVLVGMYANTPTSVIQTALYGFNESENWNKIYYNLSDFVSTNFTAQTYNLFFGVVKAPADSAKDVKVYIDNIKIVHP